MSTTGTRNASDLPSVNEAERAEDNSDSDDSDSEDDVLEIRSGNDEGSKPSPQEITDKLWKLLFDIKSGTSKQILSEGLDLTKEEDITKFLLVNQAYLSEVTTKDQNLLHLMADDSDRIPSLTPKLKGLVNALLALPANLLAQRDLEKRTPLQYALLRHNQRLARYMCEQCQNLSLIVAAPSSSTKRRATNCLHLAIEDKGRRHNDKLVHCLVDKCSKDILLAPDDEGRTPLHLAVDCKRCDADQIKIVESLVKKCDKALECTFDYGDKGSLTPYLYHVKTEQEFTAQMQRAARRVKEEGTSRRDNPFDKPKRVNSKLDMLDNESNLEPEIFDPMDPKAKDYINSPINRTHDARQQSSRFNPKVTAESSIAPSPLTVENRDVEDRTEENWIERDVYDKETNKVKTRKHSKAKRVIAVEPTEATIKAVSQYLKEYCLRSKNPDEAVGLLYEEHHEREIYFDLNGARDVLSKESLENGLGHLVLEDVLQYIAIPQLKVDTEAQPTNRRGQKAKPTKPDGNGRWDLEVLFDWLKNDKKVKTVFRIIVDDLKEPSHRDESIVNCLRRLDGLETWDWKKFDISPDVIQLAAPNVKVVHLYWSGNNAVLRGWSEEQGLRSLDRLEKVHLHFKQGLESQAWMKRCILAFTKRLGAGGKIFVEQEPVRDDSFTSVNKTVDTPADPYEKHRWITTMEKFADFLQNAESQMQPQLKLERPVTVALIDDGMDSTDRTLHSKTTDGKSFSFRDQDRKLKRPYYVSGGGHGTAMAGYICKVCPNVALYVLRLEEHRSLDPQRRNITAESAAKAVRAATKKNVDIICMSWTIAETAENKEHIEELDQAILEASSKNILMFCAATDEGAYKHNSYPAASKSKTIFKIGAAEASGQANKWVGQDSVDFILPGSNVPLGRDDDPSVKELTAFSGSSVATALASGLAAVILYCVQLAAVSEGKGQGRLNLGKYMGLKTYAGMKRAFEHIGTTSESGNKYLTVWSKFNDPVDGAKQRAGDEWISLVQNLARGFSI